MGAISLRTPVDVSACTRAIIVGARWAASTAPGSRGSPHGASTATTSAPSRLATSHIRVPNSPFTPTTTTSPGRTKFTKAVSIPPEPVALTGKVNPLLVPKASRSRAHVSSKRHRN